MKKYIFGAVLSLALITAPAFTQASSLSSTQIQSILSLLSAFGADSATISNVTTALNGGTPTVTPTYTFCYDFNRDLGAGLPLNSAEVQALATVFVKQGIAGKDFDSFNEDVAGNVVQFQTKFGIRQTGYVGPITRAKLNALYGCHGNNEQVSISEKTEKSVTGNANNIPTISSVEYYSSSRYAGADEKFVVKGDNFSAGSKLEYIDTTAASTGNSTETGYLTYILSFSPTKIIFAGDRRTGMISSVYKIRVINENGIASNAIMVNTIALSTTPSTAVSAESATTPTITSLSRNSGKAGDTITIYGKNLANKNGDTLVTFLLDGRDSGGTTPTYIQSEGTQLQFRLNEIFVANSTFGLYQIHVSHKNTALGTEKKSNLIDFTLLPTATASSRTISYVMAPAEEANILHAGETMRIYGNGFSPNAGVTVYIGSYPIGGQTTPDGSQITFIMSPSVTEGIYNLSVGDHGQTSNSITVKVAKPVPFTATISQSVPSTVAGASFTVTWGSTNAKSCVLKKLDPLGVWVNPWPQQIPAGSTSGSATAAPVNPGTLTWVNTCTDALGNTTTATFNHTVTSS